MSRISNDTLRRELLATDEQHRSSMNGLRSLIGRLFESTADDDTKAGIAVGFDRRSLLRVGGTTILGATILAACGSDSKSISTTTTGASGATTPASATTTAGTTTVGTTGAISMDITILRTASSIEELAVAAYQTAIDSGLVKNAAVGDAAKLFQAQHREHSALFQSLTKQAGGVPFTTANPAILAAIKPAIAALKDEAGVIALALQLEIVAAQTYQSNVGAFGDLKLNAAIMSVGGIEARHAAILASVLGMPAVPKAFQVTDKAAAPGTGV